MILDDCLLLCIGTNVGYSDNVGLRDQEKLDHLRSSAADYLTAQVLG